MSMTTRILSKAAGRTAAKACVASMLPSASVLSGRPFIIIGRTPLHSASSTKAVRTRQGNKQRIHSSASNSHSAAAAAVHLLDTPTATAATSIAPLPTRSQLKTLFVSSAIPMVGFGFMDNFIMIQAGGYIDATLGVQFGLATLTAAAMGQVVSDVSGVVCGGTLERFLERIKLIKPSNLSNAQRQLPLARNTAMAGAVLGVVAGCLLGASSLMFVDLEVHERQRHAVELQSMLTSMLADEEHNEASMGCEACTVYLALAEHIPAGYTDETTAKGPHLELLENAEPKSLAQKCELSQEVCVENHGESMLCAPVVSNDGKVLAVLEFRNKHNKQGSKFTDATFSEDDERTARILARHISIFMDRLVSHH